MIWCVDDDKTILDIAVYTLNSLGFSARGFSSARELFHQLEQEVPQLLLLDIMLPDMEGTQVLQALRQNARTRSVPVIMATAKGGEMDKIRCLDSGADDYLVKPFSMMEMASRVKAVLRRYREPKREISHGEIAMDDKAHSVSVGGQLVYLTGKEYALLKLFLENPGVAFSREELLQSVWGIDYLGQSRTVDVHIKTLRKKLGAAGKAVQTVVGLGYRLEVTK